MDMEQRIEQRAKAVGKMLRDGLSSFYIARAELEREGRLVEALREYSGRPAWDAVREWEAEFAPPQRTLADVARRVDMAYTRGMLVETGGKTYALVERAAMEELAAALKREGGDRG